jgi:hypothetical protein
MAQRAEVDLPTSSWVRIRWNLSSFPRPRGLYGLPWITEIPRAAQYSRNSFEMKQLPLST